MKKNLWFTTKKYGWGWTPSTWQGWGVTLAYVVLVILDSSSLSNIGDESIQTWWPWGVRLILYTVTLLAICFKKGPKPRWRWGDEEE